MYHRYKHMQQQREKKQLKQHKDIYNALLLDLTNKHNQEIYRIQIEKDRALLIEKARYNTVIKKSEKEKYLVEVEKELNLKLNQVKFVDSSVMTSIDVGSFSNKVNILCLNINLLLICLYLIIDNWS